MSKKVAILIPCYNEEITIKKVIEDCKKDMIDACIYVYDNNSSDNTLKLAKCAGALVNQVLKQGKGNVVKKMFEDIDADCYVMIDGDDTYSTRHIKEMCNYVLNEKFDMVVGDRLSGMYFRENKRLFHGFGNRLVRFFVNILYGSKINDILTGYRALSKRFVKDINITSEYFELETEMTILAIVGNYSIKEITIDYKDRPNGSKSKINTFKDGFMIIKKSILLLKEYKPFVYYINMSTIIVIMYIIFLAMTILL